MGAPMLVSVREDTAAIAALVTRVEPAAFTKLSPLGVQEQRVNVHGAFTGRPPPLGDAFQVGVAIVLWERPDVLRIPGSALVAADTGLGWAAFRVRGGRAHLVPVRIGHRGANQVEVLSGLAAGDTVVERPNDKIRGGIRVEELAAAGPGGR
jgi:HlyD family secretion protein